MSVEIIWIDAPNNFATSRGDERRHTLRAALDVSAYEALHANTFPLKPDGEFTVLTLDTGITEDGFVTFAPELITAFDEAAPSIIAKFTVEERERIESLIREFREIGATHGASDEAIGITVPTRLVTEAKALIEQLFADVAHPLIGV